MSNLREKIRLRMDEIQSMMESNDHLTDPDKVTEVIGSVSKFWSALNEEDRDYIHCARYAIENKSEWKV
jgi:hypothetical protein